MVGQHDDAGGIRAGRGTEPANDAEAGALRKLQVDDRETDGMPVAGRQRFVFRRCRGNDLDAVRYRHQLDQPLGDLRRVFDHQRVHHFLVGLPDLVVRRDGPGVRGIFAGRRCVHLSLSRGLPGWRFRSLGRSVHAMSWFFTA
jgi:hypothetical protein